MRYGVRGETAYPRKGTETDKGGDIYLAQEETAYPRKGTETIFFHFLYLLLLGNSLSP